MRYSLITGATSGIGMEIAKVFINNGRPVVLLGRNKEVLTKLKDDYKDINLNIEILAVDLLENNSIYILEEFLESINARVDVLVNNAGIGYVGYFNNIDINKHIDTINLNIQKLTELTYLIINKYMLESGGRILNVASSGAYQPGPITAVYYASKAYVLSFTSALREEYKEKDIYISALCPGATKTNFAKRSGKEDLGNAIDPKVVAIAAYNGLMKNKAIIKPGILNWIMINLTKMMPFTLSSKIVKRIQLGVKK